MFSCWSAIDGEGFNTPDLGFSESCQPKGLGMGNWVLAKVVEFGEWNMGWNEDMRVRWEDGRDRCLTTYHDAMVKSKFSGLILGTRKNVEGMFWSES